MVYAIVLAAGESKRMGALKQILPFGKSTVIETIITSLLKSSVDRVMVVAGYKASDVREVLKESEVEIRVNENYKKGMLSSIKCGVSAFPQDAEAFLICLCDQPGIRPENIDVLIDSYRKSGKGIIIPTYKGKRGHPVIFDRKYIDEILGLNEEDGELREVVWKNSKDILEVEIKNSAVVEDMDYMEDYKELVRIVKEE